MKNQNKMQVLFTKKHIVLLSALICTLLWGSAYPAVKVGYELFAIDTANAYSKILYGGVRFFIAGIITLGISIILNKKLIWPNARTLPGIISIGITQTFLEYMFYYVALSYTSGVTASILYSISTFFIVILAHFFVKNDTITVAKAAGCVIGFIGLVIANLNQGEVGGGFTFLGEGCVILAAFFLSVGNIISKFLPKEAESSAITGWQLILGSVLMIACGLIGGGSFGQVSLAAVLLMIYLCLVSSVAFTLWLILLRYNPAGKIAVYNFLSPIFGTALSGLILGENFLNLYNLAALVLVCLGIILVNRQKVSIPDMAEV